MLQVLSLGAGVQSSVLLLMSCRGELPKLDLAIFADTQWEPQGVYDHLEWLKVEAEAANIPLVTVSRGNLRKDAIEFRQLKASADGKRYASMPMHVQNPDGSAGLIRRQCTSEYKIVPIEKYLRREILNLKPRQHSPKDPVIEQWRGITVDEVRRVKESRERWYTAVYPFCGIPTNWIGPNLNYRRSDCEAWFSERYPGRKLPRSACLGCPFHSNYEWQRMRDEAPDEWEDAVTFDRMIRQVDPQASDDRKLIGMPYLHRSCKPLDEAPIDNPDQMEIWTNECEGMCGL